MHWTYSSVSSDQDLQQGDILGLSDELQSVLNKVHPWFCHQKYLGFIILTQSCDLVTGRGDPCKAPHIAVAPLRSARQVIHSMLPVLCECIYDNMYLADSKGRLASTVSRIINQNESSLGLFYLHPEAELEIGEECLATLRISVSLKASEHYNVLRSSRLGTLKTEFAHKLGWMCGYLYSRVGVQDWQINSERESEASDIVKELCEFPDIEWLSSTKLKKKLKNGDFAVDGTAENDIEQQVRDSIGREYKAIALDVVQRICAEKGVDERVANLIRMQLGNDSEFKNSVRPGHE